MVAVTLPTRYFANPLPLLFAINVALLMFLYIKHSFSIGMASELAEYAAEHAGVAEDHGVAEDSGRDGTQINDQEEELTFACSECQREFLSQHGLSTHFSKSHRQAQGDAVLFGTSVIRTLRSAVLVDIDELEDFSNSNDEEIASEEEESVPSEAQPFEDALKEVSNVILDKGIGSIRLTEKSRVALKFCDVAIRNGLSVATQNDTLSVFYEELNQIKPELIPKDARAMWERVTKTAELSDIFLDDLIKTEVTVPNFAPSDFYYISVRKAVKRILNRRDVCTKENFQFDFCRTNGYGEFTSGEYFKCMTSSLRTYHNDPNLFLLAIIMSSDEANVTNRRNVKGCFVSLGNLTLKARNNMLSRECVGYIPAVNCSKSQKKLSFYSENKRVLNLKCHPESQMLSNVSNLLSVYTNSLGENRESKSSMPCLLL